MPLNKFKWTNQKEKKNSLKTIGTFLIVCIKLKIVLFCFKRRVSTVHWRFKKEIKIKREICIVKNNYIQSEADKIKRLNWVCECVTDYM